ncbi:MAG: D-glycero-alpha-D-manno-heptose-1,7-bisphosphate 7-phosphatase [Bacteroidia bacterium]
MKHLNIDKSWALFLDRDGVINKKIENDYVKHTIEFEFISGAIDALKKLKDCFGTIVVVTNQQGIGKGVMRTEDLELIHKNMVYEIEYMGGKIDKVYFSPHLAAENHPTRKPGIGMALKAREEFKHIDFSKSIMVGDSMSDMEFGRKAGMRTVFISEKAMQHETIDFNFRSLKEFSDHL